MRGREKLHHGKPVCLGKKVLVRAVDGKVNFVLDPLWSGGRYKSGNGYFPKSERERLKQGEGCSWQRAEKHRDGGRGCEAGFIF